MAAVCLMVLGTTSGAGKSWLTTALCRYYARLGLRVAPFKAQNMSNNARVVAGGEIGSAQYFQALAARATPEVRMNPLLLKPENDTHSQVVLLGQVSQEFSGMGWRGRSLAVWPQLAAALDALREEYDLIVIEGAGSPAEINLADCDVVNMRVALHGQANCLLVTDIDRGGAFAHLYGTWALLPPIEQKLLRGFVLNKFRGDPALLAPAPQQLEALTGIPTLATLPMYWQHGLPEEDGFFYNETHHAQPTAARTPAHHYWRQHEHDAPLHIVLVCYPRISNLDEFQALRNLPGVRFTLARSPADCLTADCLILPGSKHTSSDLAWLRQQGLDGAIQQHAAAGKALLGICGGLQMLGDTLLDPHGIDGNAQGLGLLPLSTTFAAEKTLATTASALGPLHGSWAALSYVALQGYEIRHGHSHATGECHTVLAERAWQNQAGNIFACYIHGLFESPAVLRALFGQAVPTLDDTFERLADFVAEHFTPDTLTQLIAPKA